MTVSWLPMWEHTASSVGVEWLLKGGVVLWNLGQESVDRRLWLSVIRGDSKYDCDFKLVMCVSDMFAITVMLYENTCHLSWWQSHGYS